MGTLGGPSHDEAAPFAARIEDKELLELLGKARSGVIKFSGMHNARSGYHMMSKAVIQTIDELAFLLTGDKAHFSVKAHARRLRTIGRERNRPQPGCRAGRRCAVHFDCSSMCSTAPIATSRSAIFRSALSDGMVPASAAAWIISCCVANRRSRSSVSFVRIVPSRFMTAERLRVSLPRSSRAANTRLVGRSIAHSVRGHLPAGADAEGSGRKPRHHRWAAFR